MAILPNLLEGVGSASYNQETSYSLLEVFLSSREGCICNPDSPLPRLLTNRGYKKMNRNKDFWPMIFVSYSRIQIFEISIPIRMNGTKIFEKEFLFLLRNRIPKINRIIYRN